MIDTEITVRLDAERDCKLCKGAGWHWGWHGLAAKPGLRIFAPGFEPVMLRCPCVDQNRGQ
jgi:hypothetical protein